MALDNPLISVIIPIYNAEQYLGQCLDSVKGQTYRNLEIICLNDGSTDNSLEIMRKHAAQDERIRVIDKRNQGYGASCNRGLDEAHGTYISIVEPDDWLEPRMYEDMLAFANQFEEPIDIIKTAYWRIWLPDTPKQRKLNCSYKDRIHPPAQPFAIKDAAICCATIPPSGRPSIGAGSLSSAASASRRSPVPAGQTIPSSWKRSAKPTASSIWTTPTTAIARKHPRNRRRSRSAVRCCPSNVGTT